MFEGNLTYSQPDSILPFPRQKQVMLLWRWYKIDQPQKDSQQVSRELSAMEKLIAEQGNTLLERQVWLLQHLYSAERKLPTNDRGVRKRRRSW
jgi:hypothetical protein